MQLEVEATTFVRDVCNIQADGEFLDASVIRESIKRNIKQSDISVVRDENHKVNFRTPHGEYETRSDAEKAVVDKEFESAGRIMQAISQFPDIPVPGATPMYRAVNLLKLLEEQHKEGGGGGDGEVSLEDLLNPSNLAKAKENLAQAADMSEADKEFLKKLAEAKKEDPKDTPHNGAGNSAGGGISEGTQVGMTASGMATLAAARALSDRQLAAAAKVSRKLNSMSRLKTDKVTKFMPDSQGNEVRNISMRSADDIGRLKQRALALRHAARPLFNYMLMSNQFQVRERGVYTDKKQLLYILVDCSGSMHGNSFGRIHKAAGVLLHRLMAVAKGDAVVYWRFFDTTVYPHKLAASQTDANQQIKEILNEGSYNGGGTNFDIAIKTAGEHIASLNEMAAYAKPEIMVVTDGECHCHVKPSDIPGIKVHATYVCASTSPGLTALSQSSGGVVINL